MTSKADIHRGKHYDDEPHRTIPTESSTRDLANHRSSKTRVNSEPPKQVKIPPGQKSLLPEIEGSYKKLLVGVFPKQDPLARRKSKKGSLHLRERSANLDESQFQGTRAKRNYSISNHNNNDLSVSKDSLAHDSSQYKITSNSIDSGARNSFQPLNMDPSPLRVKSRKESRAMSPEKSVYHELSEITSKAKPRLHSNLNLRVKKTNATIIQHEKTSTSVSLTPFPYPIEGTKCSMRKNGIIEAYAANSNQGIVRTYNEDRVSIILNIAQPSHLDYKGEWPNCSFFGVYDGHGGSRCADFLKDTLHRFVIGNKYFPDNPTEALRQGFRDAEKEFLELAQQNKLNIDQSGSCAIVVLVLDNKCYTANVGDSRAVLSCKGGNLVIPLSRDHKPGDEDEQERIVRNGGKLYQSALVPQGKPRILNGLDETADPQMGPLRVLPGRLSVSRTFGDIEAKLEKFGGNPHVVVAEPEILVTELTDESDFIIIASDGIYDRLTNEDVVNCVWDSTKQKNVNVHEQSSQAVESVMMEALIRKTFDNITVVMLGLAGFKSMFMEAEAEKKEQPGFYFSYENHIKAKKSTSTTKVKSNVNSKESLSQETEKSRLNTDESVYENKNQSKFNVSLLQKQNKSNTITRQLIKAYRKVNLAPMPK